MTPDTILPDLQSAILCEDVRAEVSGQQTLIGILGVIPTPTVPIGFFKLCFWTRWCGGLGTFSQRVLIFDPEEKEPLADTSINFSLTDMTAHATNVHFFGRIQFERFGTYYIEVHLDDQLELRIPLPVVPINDGNI